MLSTVYYTTFFFFNDTATTEIYTLSLHDALPIFFDPNADPAVNYGGIGAVIGHELSHHFDDQGAKYNAEGQDRKSTRLNSSHANISYAVFCLKKTNLT